MGTGLSVADSQHGQQLWIFYCLPVKQIQRCPCKVFFFISSLLVGRHAPRLMKALPASATHTGHLFPGLTLVTALPSSSFSLGTFTFLLESVLPSTHDHGNGAVGDAGHSLFQAHLKKDVVIGCACLGKMVSWSKWFVKENLALSQMLLRKRQILNLF